MIILDLRENEISTKADSNSLGEYIIWARSDLGIYEKRFEIYNKAPPAEDSVGVCSTE